MGYTLSEWALTRLDDNSTVASRSEEEIYAALAMDCIPPELRENLGEIERAAQHRMPELIDAGSIRGDLHMHTSATDGRNSIREMAEAALGVGYSYIAITDHSKNLAMTNGLDDRRALEHVERIRAVDRAMEGRMRVFAGIEVDILADGALDLEDETLAQMDIVIASIHTRFDQGREEMTARVLRALENPYVRILGHPTGRLLLRREPFALDLGSVLRRAHELGVAVEHNAAPERLDLNDRDLRLAKELGAKIVINSDSHDARNLGKMEYGLRQLRRAWLGPQDVLNTLGADQLLAALRPRPGDTVQRRRALGRLACRAVRPDRIQLADLDCAGAGACGTRGRRRRARHGLRPVRDRQRRERRADAADFPVMESADGALAAGVVRIRAAVPLDPCHGQTRDQFLAVPDHHGGVHVCARLRGILDHLHDRQGVELTRHETA